MRFTLDFATLPDEARDWFLALPEGLGSQRFFRANELLNAYVDRLAHGHVTRLRGEPVARAPHWQWLLRKLERAGLAELDPWGRLAVLREPDEPAAEVKRLALAEFPDLAPSFALFDTAAAGYDEFLRGARDGASILLAPATLEVWQRYFDNADVVYAANNAVAARLVAEAARGNPGEKRGAGSGAGSGVLELLELGGGFGSAAEAVLARAKGAIARYRFTEKSPWFLSGAKRRFRGATELPPIEFATLDVDQPFAAQGAAAASAGVVLAVNVLHVAKHLGRTLAEIRRSLKPGGALVLVECVRPAPGVPIYVDYPFQLLDEFMQVEDVGPARPHGGFLTARHWRALLDAAGFELEVELPDHDIAGRWYGGLHLVGLLARARARS